MVDEPLSVTFDTSELQEVAEKYPDVIDRMLELTSLALLANIIKEAPVDTGRLSGSYQWEKLGPMSYAIGSNVAYRWFVIGGTDPHIIEATTAKALHFFWEQAGGFVFFKSVQHPGTQANPFIDRALETTEGSIDEIAEIAMKEHGIQ